MGYNLRGGSPAVTGSIDPLTSPLLNYDLTDTVNAFLAQVPASKIILGLPWYGEAWSTGTANTGNVPPANPATYGQPAEVYYSTAAGLAAQDPGTTPCQAGWPQPCVLGKFYDTVEQTAWTAYYGNYGGTQTAGGSSTSTTPRRSGQNSDAIDGWNLRGVGIWALGYDNNNGDGDLTNTIAAKFETGAEGGTYVPMAPARLLDTRVGNGLSGKLSANVPADVPGHRSGRRPGQCDRGHRQSDRRGRDEQLGRLSWTRADRQPDDLEPQLHNSATS